MTEFVLGKIKFTWQGDWAVSTAYEKDDIVKFGGNTYVCTTGHTSGGAIPDFYIDIAKWDVHVEGVTHKGDHADATYYKINDIVKSDQHQYICTTQHTSIATINLTNFTLYVEGGPVAAQAGKSGQFLSTDGTNTTWVDIVEAAPGALDTLNELAASLADDADFAGTMTTALAGKEPTLTAGTTAQYYRGDKTWQTLTVDPTMGGDMSGTASNAQIVANKVGVTELDVTDGTDGQALMTDGSGTMTFGDVDALPTQTSNAGKFLTTDGTDSSWGALSVTAAAVSDQANTSTSYFDIPSGTTAQRPGSPSTGSMRFNSETNEMEHWSGTGWVGFAGTVPIITSIGPSTAAETGTTITINGTNFSGSSTVQLIGTDNSIVVPQTVTFVDINTLSITTPVLTVALEPYDVRVTNPDGQYYTLVNSLDAGGVPAWTTPAGSVGTMFDVVTTPNAVHFTLVATDPDGTAITYTETTSVLATANLTLNSTTGAITGNSPTTQAPNNATTYNFDVDASDGVNITSRSFSITIMDVPTGGTTSTHTITGQGYTSHTFLSSGDFYNAADLICDIMIVAGGGAGGNSHTSNGNGGGGGGGMVVATDYTLPAGAHAVAVGAGGSGSGGGSNSPGNDGNNSTVASTPTLIAVAGGGGSGNHSSTTGRDGGSGGGGSRSGTGSSNGQGGSTTQDSAGTQHNPGLSIAAYGNDGGYSASGDWNGAGGGGAGTPGYGYAGSAPYNDASPGSHPGGDGGHGQECNLRDGGFAAGNTNLFYAGGGGGAGNSSERAGDGWHGGGRGYGTTSQYSWNAWPDEVNGTTLGHSNIQAIANTGGGGGAGSYWANNHSGSGNVYGSGTGGSGIVVIRYKAQ